MNKQNKSFQKFSLNLSSPSLSALDRFLTKILEYTNILLVVQTWLLHGFHDLFDMSTNIFFVNKPMKSRQGLLNSKQTDYLPMSNQIWSSIWQSKNTTTHLINNPLDFNPQNHTLADKETYLNFIATKKNTHRLQYIKFFAIVCGFAAFNANCG